MKTILLLSGAILLLFLWGPGAGAQEIKKSRPIFLERNSPIFIKKSEPVDEEKNNDVDIEKNDPSDIEKDDPIYKEKRSSIHTEKNKPIYMEKNKAVDIRKNNYASVEKEQTNPIDRKKINPIYTGIYDSIEKEKSESADRTNPIYKELAELGVMTTGEITSVYGVPCVEVKLKNGQTIMALIYATPSLKKISHIVQDRIALLNKTHYLLNMDGPEEDNMSTVKNTVLVPLDYTIKPKILPAYLPRVAENDKFILIDRKQQFMGLYEKGWLKHTFPISSGKHGTPARKFTILNMDEFHNSSLYDNAQMDLALNIGNNYFIHEGIVPGYAASHGCIRVFPMDARYLFYKWAKPGIPGEIIN